MCKSVYPTFARLSMRLTQCDQIGLFLKFKVKSFLTKVAQMCVSFFGWFENIYFHVQTAVVTFGATFGFFGYFIFQRLVTLIHIDRSFSFHMPIAFTFYILPSSSSVSLTSTSYYCPTFFSVIVCLSNFTIFLISSIIGCS